MAERRRCVTCGQLVPERSVPDEHTPNCEHAPPLTPLGPNPQGRPEYRHEQTGIIFVECPAGDFLMGSPPDEADRQPDEGPQHRVTLDAFLIAKTEVTQAQWQKVMGSNPSHFKKGGDLPVEQVSWDDCQEFCRKTGLRLPTEADWEMACRAGTTTRFCFGDAEADLGQYAWYLSNAAGKTHPVGQKKPNAWGIHDMHGNVFEWCQDGWHGNYGGAPLDGSAWDGCPGAAYRVHRGGSFDNEARRCRSAFRNRNSPDYRDCLLGLRPARSL